MEVEGIRVAERLQQPALVEDVPTMKPGPKEQKEWLARVDEAYYSGSDSEDSTLKSDADRDKAMEDYNGNEAESDMVNGIYRKRIKGVMAHWSAITGVDIQSLLYTSFRKVESDVGKKKQSDMERVAGLAVTVGGGW